MSRTCLDCGVPLIRKGARGSWPERCDQCRKDRNNRRTQAWRASQGKDWQQKNREQARRFREGFTRPRRSAPEQARFVRTSRRAQQFERRYEGSIDLDARRTLWLLDADPCVYCGGPADAVDHIDQRIGNAWDNFTATCTACNTSKGSLPLLRALLARQLRTERERVQRELDSVLGKAA